MKSIWINALLFTAGCGADVKHSVGAHEKVLQGYEQMLEWVDTNPKTQFLLDIDHKARAEAYDKDMPEAHVLMFRNPAVEIPLVAQDPRVMMEMPMKVLAWDGDGARVSWNDSAFLSARYGLESSKSLEAMDRVLREAGTASGLPAHPVDWRPVEGDGLRIYDVNGSVDDFVARFKTKVEAVDGVVVFGTINYQAEAAQLGLTIPPATLVLFGNPKLGGPAMADAPELGLDQFCQKIAVWEDDSGVHVAHNDIAWQSARRGKGMTFARRMVRFRLNMNVKGSAEE